jgi:1-acyl-sn-glycerol-3-phosphate acyltransferase
MAKSASSGDDAIASKPEVTEPIKKEPIENTNAPIWSRSCSTLPWCAFLTALMLVNCLALCMVMLPTIPLKLVSRRWHRKLNTVLISITIKGFLCVPFQLGGLQVVYYNGKLGEEIFNTGNMMVIANHVARVDALAVLAFAYSEGRRLRHTFVTEWQSFVVPIIGWFLYLNEDVSMNRDYEKDAPVLRNAVTSWVKGPGACQRFMLMTPEGKLVDPGNTKDEQFIARGNSRMESLGRKPFEFVLVPRHAGCWEMAKNFPEGTRHNGVTVGILRNGNMLNRRLNDDRRIVADMFDAFLGGITLHCAFTEIKNSDLTSPNNDDEGQNAKNTLLDTYAMHDKALAHLERHGTYEGSVVSTEAGQKMIMSPLQGFSSLVFSVSLVGICLSRGDVRDAPFQAMRLTVLIAVLIGLFSFLMSGVYFSQPKKD